MVRWSMWRVVSAMALGVVLMMVAQPSQAQLARVGWTPILSTQSGQCLDIQALSTRSGAIVQEAACKASPSQQWHLQPTANGFLIIHQPNWLCLTVVGTSVVQAACGAGSTWTVTANGNAVTLTSTTNQLCLTGTAGAALALGGCSGASVATWVFQSGVMMPNQLATFQAGHSGQCMVLGSAGTLVQNPCSGAAQEQWRIVPTTTLYDYTLVMGSSGLCLTAASLAPGATLTTSACSGSVNQMFSMLPITPGYLICVNSSSLCLDVAGASTNWGSAIVLASSNTVLDQEWSVSRASVPASWTGVTQLNNDPMAVANLPDGTVLTWSSNDPFNYEWDIGNAKGQTYYSIFTPSTMASGVDRTDTGGADMFCPGTANLADGRILVNGGSSSPKTTIYDPATGLFSADANMNIPRGYQGDTPLSNGSVLTLGGSWSGGIGGKTGEIWTKGQGWTTLPGVPDDPFVGPEPGGAILADSHLWLFSFSNGIVLHAGPGAQMHWIFTAGSGAVYPAGTRSDDVYSINGSAVMYDVGKILKAGGAPAYNKVLASPSAYTISLTDALRVTKVAPMAYPRTFANGVALPSGQVLIVGGQSYAEQFTDTAAVLIPELWDPQTGVFQQLAPMQTPRTYHSTAILLNDGRVFVGGGWQCGYACATNHFNTEILSPPYLLNADGTTATRPVIKTASATAAPGGTLTVTTDSPIGSFALMRNSSVTHSLNNDQRRIPLTIQSLQQSGSGNSYTLNIPADTGTVLPGYYMLFAMNAYGVPSVSASVLIH